MEDFNVQLEFGEMVSKMGEFVDGFSKTDLTNLPDDEKLLTLMDAESTMLLMFKRMREFDEKHSVLDDENRALNSKLTRESEKRMAGYRAMYYLLLKKRS